MRILAVTHTSALSGGANRSLLQVMRLLQEQYGAEFELMMPQERGEMDEKCAQLGITTHHVRMHSCCTVFRGEPKDILRWIKLRAAPVLDRIAAGKISRACSAFDLVYTNDKVVVLGAYLARQMRIPHVWHVRSLGKANGNRYARQIDQMMRNETDAVIAISRKVMEECAEQVNEEKLHLVYNGVPLCRATAQTAHDGYRLLLTGRLVPEKGQHIAIEALKRLKKRGKLGNISLSFAGSLPEYANDAYLKQLKSEARELGDAVRFLGEIRNMEQLRAEMDAELVCSTGEAFGRVTIEAMRQGLLVIGSDGGATPELIEDGKTGLLFRNGETDALAACSEKAAEQRAWSRKIAEKGQESVSNRFTEQKNAEEIYQIMKQVLGGSAR